MAYENKDNRYYKFGMVRPNPAEASEQRQIVARFEVGPGRGQVSLAELREASLGKSVQKPHFNGRVRNNRIDVQLMVGDSDRAFSQTELKEIYRFEKEKADARAALAPEKASTESVDDLKAMLKKQQKQIDAMLKANENPDASQ